MTANGRYCRKSPFSGLAEKSQRHSQAVQISGWGNSQLFCISLYDSANGAYGQSGFDPNCNRVFAKNVATYFSTFSTVSAQTAGTGPEQQFPMLPQELANTTGMRTVKELPSKHRRCGLPL